MFLEVVNFDPASGFTAEDLNLIETEGEEDGEDVAVFGKENYIVSRSTRQYLYRIHPISPIRNPGTKVHVHILYR